MAFDAGMLAAVTCELEKKILGSKVDKVFQPEKDEIILFLRSFGGNTKLLLSAAAGASRVNITTAQKENPMTPPMLCMLLRKHLCGSRISAVRQLGFERAMEIEFDGRDELEYACKKYLVIEIMGTYSNIILLDGDKKIINAMKLVDFSMSNKRRILPGMLYEAPPQQEKKSDPLTADKDGFIQKAAESEGKKASDFILESYFGISPLIASEIAFRSSCPTVDAGSAEKLWSAFSEVIDIVRNREFVPTLLLRDGKPHDFSFTEIRKQKNNSETRESFGELIDEYYLLKDRTERQKRHAADILRLLTNAEARISKKLRLFESDLAKCEERKKYKLFGDVITASIYKIPRGVKKITLDNYYSDPPEPIEVTLDERLSPADNAQKYYKMYSKSKTAKEETEKQKKLAHEELAYIDTVFDALTKADTESDFQEIRRELCSAGYASKMQKNALKKTIPSKPMAFKTTEGLRVLCGKNNIQNDDLTFKTASKGDIWFHAKNVPGSHVILFTNGVEPADSDYTEAAMIAAYYSKGREGEKVAVDYTPVKNMRKPAGSKPGFVTYKTYNTAYVTPDEQAVKALAK